METFWEGNNKQGCHRRFSRNHVSEEQSQGGGGGWGWHSGIRDPVRLQEALKNQTASMERSLALNTLWPW